jgi:hypothetical protein
LVDFLGDSAGPAVDGVVHFLPRRRSLLAWDSVLCFDLESEKWTKTIQGPLKEKEDIKLAKRTRINIMEFNKSLCMIQTVRTRSHIWLLVDPCNSIWVKTYSIPVRSSLENVFPVRVIPGGIKLLFYYSFPVFPAFDNVPLVLHIYDSRYGTCTPVMNMPKHIFNRIGLCSLQALCGAPKN